MYIEQFDLYANWKVSKGFLVFTFCKHEAKHLRNKFIKEKGI